MDIKCVPADFAPQLADLWAETFEQAYRNEHHADDIGAYCTANFSLDAAKAVLNDPCSICKVVFQDQEPMGFYVLKHHACSCPLDGASSELKQIYILAQAYGTGLGKRLFDDAVQCAQNAHKQWIWLSVSDRNIRAQSFYQKRDFVVLGEGPVFEVGTERLTSTIMAYKLTV